MNRVCYTRNEATKAIVIVKEGHKGYWPAEGMTPAAADRANASLGVTPAIREAMTLGSIFGWDVPGADLTEAERRFAGTKLLASE